MGSSGGVPFHCRGTDSISSCKSATRRDKTVVYIWDQKLAMKAKDRKDDILLFVLQQNHCQRRSSGYVVFNYC